MLWATLQIARGHGEDRFHSSTKNRRSYHQHLQYLWRSRRSAFEVSSIPPLVFQENAAVPEILDLADRTEWELRPSNFASSSSSSSSFSPSSESESAARCSNLDRFLESTTPSVPARYLSKTTMGGCRRCNVEYMPYFVLGELWDSFREWSAYGVSVPLVLNGDDCVVQYYVPYLSGIQLYGHSTVEAVSSRRIGEMSDADNFGDFSSDGSNDCKSEKCMKSKGVIHNFSKFSMNGLSLRNINSARMDGVSSNYHETEHSDGTLLFEFLEKNAPHSRKPLTDKIADLACQFPQLISLRSCDLSPISWISVAWYPIYRIPTGTTLKGLDACFLAFYYLSTQMKDDKSSSLPVITYRQGSGVPNISLPAFGLASYKFKGSMWTPPNEKCGSQLTVSLLKAAGDWLHLLQVDLSDRKSVV